MQDDDVFTLVAKTVSAVEAAVSSMANTIL